MHTRGGTPRYTASDMMTVRRWHRREARVALSLSLWRLDDHGQPDVAPALSNIVNRFFRRAFLSKPTRTVSQKKLRRQRNADRAQAKRDYAYLGEIFRECPLQYSTQPPPIDPQAEATRKRAASAFRAMLERSRAHRSPHDIEKFVSRRAGC